jgi:hypothetical protein
VAQQGITNDQQTDAYVIYGPVGEMSRKGRMISKNGALAYLLWTTRKIIRSNLVKNHPDDCCGILLITDAEYPAPNPLSIFTTMSPVEQELSIPIRAATPFRPVP